MGPVANGFLPRSIPARSCLFLGVELSSALPLVTRQQATEPPLPAPTSATLPPKLRVGGYLDATLSLEIIHGGYNTGTSRRLLDPKLGQEYFTH